MAYKLTNKNKITAFDPPCRKTMYNTLEEARDIIKYMAENKGVGKEIHPYKCNICGFWHLTSRSK
jgi:hypothetical protein